jgi:hypothetical protein
MITGEQLLDAFAAYNQQIWPMHIMAYVLGAIAVFLAFKKSLWASRGYFWRFSLLLAVGGTFILAAKCRTGLYHWLCLFGAFRNSRCSISDSSYKTWNNLWDTQQVSDHCRGDIDFLCHGRLSLDRTFGWT